MSKNNYLLTIERNEDNLLIKEENHEDESNKEFSNSIHNPQQPKVKDYKQVVHLIKL